MDAGLLCSCRSPAPHRRSAPTTGSGEIRAGNPRLRAAALHRRPPRRRRWRPPHAGSGEHEDATPSLVCPSRRRPTRPRGPSATSTQQHPRPSLCWVRPLAPDGPTIMMSYGFYPHEYSCRINFNVFLIRIIFYTCMLYHIIIFYTLIISSSK